MKYKGQSMVELQAQCRQKKEEEQQKQQTKRKKEKKINNAKFIS